MQRNVFFWTNNHSKLLIIGAVENSPGPLRMREVFWVYKYDRREVHKDERNSRSQPIQCRWHGQNKELT